MLYEYQYDIAAAFAALIVLTLFLVRHTYKSRSGTLFLLIIIFNLAASIIDIFAKYTITYPALFSEGVLYAANMIYLLTCSFELLLFFLYVESVLGLPKLRKPIRIICVVLAVYEAVILVLSYKFHLVFYFDEMLNYCRGPLMISLYAIALFGLIATIVLLIVCRRRLNRYQVLSFTCFLCGMGICIVFQSLYPQYVIGNLAAGMLIIFLYAVFENPGYYMYGSTQCMNRRAFMNTLKYFDRKQLSFSAAAFQLTEYEFILRGMGHEAVNQYSRRVAETLYQYYKHDAYCLNDSTFVVLRKGGSIEDAEKIARSLLRRFEEKIFVCCVASSQIPSADVNTIMVIESMLSSRAAKLTAEQIKTDIIDKSLRVAEVEQYLEEVIEKDGLEVYYQPILDVRKKKFRSAEALVRLPMNGRVRSGPDEFIPIAETSGMIRKIGASVLHKVCEFTSTEEFKSLGVDYIEVNLSPAQCAMPGMGQEILDIIQECGGNVSGLNFEITETAEIIGGGLEESMGLLSKNGVTFSIDDFGSGFASAEYLFSLPISIVKIDKNILWHAMNDENAMVVLKSTMHMVKELGKEIVVEGVENEEMARVIIENGGDFMQGYLYSKPLSREDYVAFQKEHLNDGA